MPGDKDQGIERCQTRGEHGENPISNMIFLIKKEQGKDAILDGRAKPRSPALKVDFPSVFSSGTVSSSAAVSGPFPFRVGWYEQGTSLSCFGGPLGLLPSFWDFLSSLFCFQLSVPLTLPHLLWATPRRSKGEPECILQIPLCIQQTAFCLPPVTP